MEEYQPLAKRFRAAPLGEVCDAFTGDASDTGVRYADGQIITAAGVVTAVRTKTTKNNTVMAYVTMEDLTGSVEMLVFARLLVKAEALLKEGAAILVSGRISGKEGEAPKLVLEELGALSEHPQMLSGSDYSRGSRIAEAPPEVPQMPYANVQQVRPEDAEMWDASRLYLRFNEENEGKREQCMALLRVFQGQTPVILYDAASREYTDAGEPQYVMKDPVLNDALRTLLGSGNVVWKKPKMQG